jgi:hemerythrin-like domain-containing protein
MVPSRPPSIEPTDPRLLAEPLDFLEAEHYRQRAALAHLERVRAEASPERRASLARLVLDFVINDVAAHVADEEGDLFPLLRRRCPESDGIERVLALVSAEHGRDRDLAAPVAEGLALCARREAPGEGFAAAVAAFVDSQRRHLAWENAFVLPLARKRLTRHDRRRLAAAMAARRGLRRARPAVRAGYFGK